MILAKMIRNCNMQCSHFFLLLAILNILCGIISAGVGAEFEKPGFEVHDGWTTLNISAPTDTAIRLVGSSDLNRWYPLAEISHHSGSVKIVDDFPDYVRQRYYSLNRELETRAPFGRTFWVDPKEGDDSIGAVGYPERPFKTLEKVLELVENGDTIFLFGGTYYLTINPSRGGAAPSTAPLQLVGKRDICIKGIGNAVRLYGEGSGDFLNIQDCENISIEHLIFEGNKPAVGPVQPGIYTMVSLRGVNREIRIRSCRFLNFGDHGVSHLWGGKTSTFVTVASCYFFNGGNNDVPELRNDGAAISGIGSYWTVRNNTIVDCVRGIEIEGATDEFPTRSVMIVDNQIVNSSDRAIMLFSTNTDQYSNIVIARNMIDGVRIQGNGTGSGITVGGGKEITISDNRITECDTWGIAATSGSKPLRQIDIRGNWVSHCEDTGIVVWQKLGSAEISAGRIEANHVLECGRHGIFANGMLINIANNCCYDNGRSFAGSGILIAPTPDAPRSEISIFNNDCRNTIDEDQTQQFGIWIQAGVHESVVKDNLVRSQGTGFFVGIRDDGIDTLNQENIE